MLVPTNLHRLIVNKECRGQLGFSKVGNHNASLMRPKKVLNETIALRVRRHSTVMQVIGKISCRSSLIFVT
jgi:hypothetical protein